MKIIVTFSEKPEHPRIPDYLRSMEFCVGSAPKSMSDSPTGLARVAFEPVSLHQAFQIIVVFMTKPLIKSIEIERSIKEFVMTPSKVVKGVYISDEEISDPSFPLSW